MCLLTLHMIRELGAVRSPHTKPSSCNGPHGAFKLLTQGRWFIYFGPEEDEHVVVASFDHVGAVGFEASINILGIVALRNDCRVVGRKPTRIPELAISLTSKFMRY